jgi:hypothetical protein
MPVHVGASSRVARVTREVARASCESIAWPLLCRARA